MLQLRRQYEKATTAQRKKVFDKVGLAIEQSPVVGISPALDMFVTRPSNAAYSEYQGISKRALTALVDHIISPRFRDAFAARLQVMHMPTGWGWLQSIATHLQSYKISECARATACVAILLRISLKAKEVDAVFLKVFGLAMKEQPDMQGLTTVEGIAQCFADIAHSNSALFAHGWDTAAYRRLQSKGIQGRKAFEMLVDAGESVGAERISQAAKNKFKRATAAAAKAKAKQSTARQKRALSISSEGSQSSVLTETDKEIPIEDEERGDNIGALIQAARSKPTNTKKGAASGRLRAIPNVHVMLHFPDLARQYNSPRNALTFAGEDKHR